MRLLHIIMYYEQYRTRCYTVTVAVVYMYLYEFTHIIKAVIQDSVKAVPVPVRVLMKKPASLRCP